MSVTVLPADGMIPRPFTIIDSDDYAASGIETMFFPGGEPHIKVPPFKGRRVLLFLKLRTWSDVGLATLLIDALGRQPGVRFRIFVPYFPGARQDRSDGTCGLTLQVMATLLTDSRSVFVFDGHSPALEAHADIAREFMPADLVPERRANVAGVIAPDDGALGRAKRFRDAFYPAAPVICASKNRDTQTGRLSNYQLQPLPRDGQYIVVDDICDGGGTFNLLADAFAANPLSSRCSLELFVSHGIFSKGLDAISPLFSHITTTDSWCRLPSSDRLTVLPLAPLFDTIMGSLHV